MAENKETETVEDAVVEPVVEETAPVEPEQAEEAKPAEIDWSTVDPSQIPHEVVAKTAAFNGVREDLRREREMKRLAEEVALLKQPTTKVEAVVEEDPLAKIADDEPLTKAEVKKLLDRRERQEARAREQETAAQQSQRVADSEAALLASYDPKKDIVHPREVLEVGVPFLKERYPGLVSDILRSKDPAREAYKLILQLHPELSQKASSRQTETLLNGLKSPVAPKTGGKESLAQDLLNEAMKTGDPARLQELALEASERLAAASQQ